MKLDGFKTSHGDEVSYTKVLGLLDANGSETLLTKVVCGADAKIEASCREFVEEKIRKENENDRLSVNSVYSAYVSFCEGQGKVPQPRNVLGRVMVKALGKHNTKYLGERQWRGYRLVN